jgi:hypothetical protein|tara:strand:- start:189 stop:575 length:387 start_codon:yes stop_codon:yes gene_type:complete
MINIFKKTILLQIFIFISLITFTIIEESLLPFQEVPSDFNIMEGIVFLFIIVLLPFMWYFLYKLKPIGKKLFIFYLILGAISYFIISDYSYVVTSLTPFLEFGENALILLDGIILAFLFFTDVKENFK